MVARALATLLVLPLLVVLPPGAAAAGAPRARVDDGGRATPCDVRVSPADDVVRAVDRAGRGATICLDPGRYRLTGPIRPQRGQTILGRRAVLDGSRLLSRFEHRRDGWAVRGQRQEGDRNGECLRGTACTYPDDVLRDGRPLARVLSRDRLGPGRYYFDYRRDTIHLGSDPRGHRIEALVAPAAVASRPGGSDVTVRGLTVEHFATRAQHGAIQTAASGWTIQATTVRDNHGAGITTQGLARVLDNHVARNGQLGVGGTGRATLVEGNTIEGNGGGGFDPAWEAGGAKWAVTRGLVVRDNEVRGNTGPGLWTDIDCQDTTYVGNVVRDNTWMGIFHEISADAVITDNVVTGNGHGFDAWLWGSGILLAGSHDVEVRGNRLARNAKGIGLVQQDRGVSDVDGRPRRLHDVRIVDNTVRTARSESGLVEDDGDRSVFDDETITWSGNTWLELGDAPFLWDDAALTLAEWRALGHDD